jgi:cysteine synthase A
MKQTRDGFIDSIGNTPLIRLNAASAATGCEIYGKAEFLNPGGSVKDRAALAIVTDAERRGLLRPGGVIVEGTAGNTGIGLALVGNARGYRTVIVMPETQSQEKKDMLRLCGADLRLVPAVPYANPNNYVRYSGRLAEEMAASEPNGAIWANQFDNTANRDGHYKTTGPEIWQQTDGKVDGFTCSVGSGGTLAGVGMALKERNPAVAIALSDPMGSALYGHYARGELKAEGNSITEGIGQGRVTANLVDAPIDLAFQITDEEALPVLFDLVVHEGLVLGGSTAINIVGAMKLARHLGRGKTIVTVLADGGQRYQSKLFNPAFLRERKLPVPAWLA